jgi:hypothetical protein
VVFFMLFSSHGGRPQRRFRGWRLTSLFNFISGGSPTNQILEDGAREFRVFTNHYDGE